MSIALESFIIRTPSSINNFAVDVIFKILFSTSLIILSSSSGVSGVIISPPDSIPLIFNIPLSSTMSLNMQLVASQDI